MREIKFRYWLKSKDGEDEGATWLTLPEIEESPYPLKADWEILACDQWTGLTDKNGQDIYEGDIISYYSDNGCIRADYRIVWNEEAAVFEALSRHGPIGTYLWRFSEITGNVHEKVNQCAK